ncbi:hypothetical protein ACFX2I_030181 [Malus domestica]
MIKSVGNTSLQSITDRDSFGRRCAKAANSTQSSRSMEHPSKVAPHPTHTSTESSLAPSRVRVDLNSPVPGPLPVKARTGSGREGGDNRAPCSISQAGGSLPEFNNVLPP